MLFWRKKRSDKFELTPEALQQIEEEYAELEKREQRQKRRKRRRFFTRLIAVCLAVIALNLLVLYQLGVIKLAEPRKRDFPTRGVYADSGLGEINWRTLESQNVSFVYLRATKGASFTDNCFEDNFKGTETSLMTGAVHDFDFSADGEAQAANFIAQVGDSLTGRLIPALDISMNVWESFVYADDDGLREEIDAFVQSVQSQYGCEVMLICSKSSYESYGKDGDNPVWLINTFSEPESSDSLAVWEYSEKGKVGGFENSSFCSLLVGGRGVSVEEFAQKYLVG